MRTLYPPLRSFSHQTLQLNARHNLSVEHSGNPSGIPVLILHDGPGAALKRDYRRLFDPERYHIIAFDQRGCGQSKPLGELKDNTTQAIVADIELLRSQLDIKQWILFGCGWGALLALCYAINHPQQVRALLLQGASLGRSEDIDWQFASHGAAARIYPEHYRNFSQECPSPCSSQDILQHYQMLLTSDNELSRLQAARSWCRWRAQLCSVQPSQELLHEADDPHFALPMARLENHYLCHSFFIPEHYLLDHLDILRPLKLVMIHGRYDLRSPIDAVMQLAWQWPDSELQIIPTGGHYCFDNAISDALVKASDSLAKQWEE